MMNDFHKILILFLCVGLDQYTKLWALSALAEEPIEVFPFFRLFLAFNDGIAFSVSVPFIFLIVLSFLFLGWIFWWVFTKKHFLLEEIGFLGIIAGGAGNLIDRLTRGEVIDFLSFWNFPVFNVADICITVGIVLVLWTQIKNRKQKKTN